MQTDWTDQRVNYDIFFTIEKHGFLLFTEEPEIDERVVLSDNADNLHWVTDLTNLSILTKSMYYGLTTLTTIGYGDMSPITIPEKILGAVIMMFGVALFSHFIGFLQEMIERQRQLTKTDHY